MPPTYLLERNTTHSLTVYETLLSITCRLYINLRSRNTKQINTMSTTHSQSDLQFILNVRVTLNASDVDTWLPVFKSVREKVLAEPECKFFLLGRLVNIDPLTRQPGTIPEDEVAISWSEGFSASMEWLGEVQIKKPYYKEYFETVVPLDTSSKSKDLQCERFAMRSTATDTLRPQGKLSSSSQKMIVVTSRPRFSCSAF